MDEVRWTGSPVGDNNVVPDDTVRKLDVLAQNTMPSNNALLDASPLSHTGRRRQQGISRYLRFRVHVSDRCRFGIYTCRR